MRLCKAEIDNAAKTYFIRKSAGIGDITNEMLKYGGLLYIFCGKKSVF